MSKSFCESCCEVVLYLTFAAILVFFAVLIGPGVFKGFNFVGSYSNWHVYNFTDYSIKASDAVSYYLQALLAVVIGFLTLKNNRDNS